MNLDQITKIATYQHEYWKEAKGKIVEVSIKKKQLLLEDKDTSIVRKFKLSPNAMKQTYERLGIRGTRSDFKDNPDFVQMAVMVKVNDQIMNPRIVPTKVIYDMTTNEAKAVMTQRYERLPNLAIVKYVKKKYGSCNARFSHINDWGMKVSVGAKNGRFSSYDNDDFVHGINFGNSETGNGALYANQFITRVRCQNGWVTNYALNMIRFPHIYKNLQEILNRELKQMGDVSAIIPLINKAKKKPYSIESVEEMPRRLSQLKIATRHFDGIIRAWNTEPLGVDDQNRINDWGIFNAITRYVSHEYKLSPKWSLKEQTQLMRSPFQLIYMR